MNIIINGRAIEVDLESVGGKISYDNVVIWSGREVGHIWTVVYAMPPGVDRRDGMLIPGQSVRPENGMVFNICNTSNA